MFFYKSALKQLELQMNIIKDEFKLIYNYDLIDHIDTRIKEPKSIVKKMEKKKYDKTYLNLIEKINDIAGIRIVCTLKDDLLMMSRSRTLAATDEDRGYKEFLKNQQINLENGFITQEEYEQLLEEVQNYATIID